MTSLTCTSIERFDDKITPRNFNVLTCSIPFIGSGNKSRCKLGEQITKSLVLSLSPVSSAMIFSLAVNVGMLRDNNSCIISILNYDVGFGIST